VRDGDWKLVAQHDKPWELYNLTADPTEMKNLAAKEGQRVSAMAAAWDAWAERCDVLEKRGARTSAKAEPKAKTPGNPEIANRPLMIRCDVETEAKDGVILAQGGNQHGYALHLKDGRLVFTVRIDGKATAIAGTAVSGKFSVAAELKAGGAMTLAVNGKPVAEGNAGGFIPKQPQDALSIGEDARTAVGDYAAPHPLKGAVTNVSITSPKAP
jgi:Concanavalin A-like lectin/glucanases superfamily